MTTNTIDARDETIATLTAENTRLKLEVNCYAARLAAIRHWLGKIKDVAGFPGGGWCDEALKL